MRHHHALQTTVNDRVTTKAPVPSRHHVVRPAPAFALILSFIALLGASPAFAATGLAADSADQLHTSAPLSESLRNRIAYALGHGIESSVLSGVTGTLFVFGHLIGTVILGIALWQARMVPSSLAIALATLRRDFSIDASISRTACLSIFSGSSYCSTRSFKLAEMMSLTRLKMPIARLQNRVD